MIKNCYCDDKSVPREEGLPLGFCGFCDICHAPGHTRPFPGASPQTGAWCDFHYGLSAWLSPNGRYGFFIWIGSAIAGTIVLSLIFREGILALILRLILLLVLIFILQSLLYFMLMKITGWIYRNPVKRRR